MLPGLVDHGGEMSQPLEQLVSDRGLPVDFLLQDQPLLSRRADHVFRLAGRMVRDGHRVGGRLGTDLFRLLVRELEDGGQSFGDAPAAGRGELATALEQCGLGRGRARLELLHILTDRDDVFIDVETVVTAYRSGELRFRLRTDAHPRPPRGPRSSWSSYQLH